MLFKKKPDPYWEALRIYRAEVARGIVHTDEYDREMLGRQRRWNFEQIHKDDDEPQ